MQIPPKPFSWWKRQTGYPIFSRDDGGLSIQESFYANTENVSQQDLASLELISYTDEGENILYPSRIVATPNENQGIFFINFSYTRPNGASGGSTAQDGQPEYTLEDSGQQIPIDRRDNLGQYFFTGYRAKWDHHLVVPIDYDPDPADAILHEDHWETAQDITLAFPNNDERTIRWVKEQDSINPEIEFVFRKATKSAVETYLAPSPVVVETVKYRSYATAAARKAKLGVIPPTSGPFKRPKKDFNILAESGGRFLVVSSTVTFDGKRWAVTTRYQWAPGWDTDLYELESI